MSVLGYAYHPKGVQRFRGSGIGTSGVIRSELSAQRPRGGGHSNDVAIAFGAWAAARTLQRTSVATGGRGKGGFDWRQYTRPTDDPELQKSIRERIERFLHDPTQTTEIIKDVFKEEKVTYKRYCELYGIVMVKLGKGDYQLEKVNNEQSPFADLLEILVESTGGARMETRVLLHHVKSSEPELWKRLMLKGVNNCSEKKLMANEDEVKKYFDVSPDWWYLSPKGQMSQEYAKPILLNHADHGAVSQRAAQAVRSAVAVLRQDKPRKKATAAEMFCAFTKFQQAPPEVISARILAQREHASFQKMLGARQRLPTFQRREELLAAYDSNDVLVVCGATGCGKTTQLPQFLMEALAEKGGGRVLCTQPRRISATSVAERVASERGEELGESVGYQIRFEHKAGPNTALLYCTVGILLRHLGSNATMEGVSLVIVDEVHERDVNTDFALLILRDLLAGPRPDLKVVLMSATIDASGFIEYFQAAPSRGADLRVGFIEIPGKTNYPIEELWAEDILRDVLPGYEPAGPPPPKGKGRGNDVPMRNTWASEPGAVAQKLPGEADSVCRGVSNMLRRPLHVVDFRMISEVVVSIAKTGDDGAILIFVPGWAEIAMVLKELEKRQKSVHGEVWRIFPLHSMVPPHEQRKIFDVVPAGERKIIVSTNIAETSITVEDVVYVIDAGLIKGTTYTPTTNVAALECMLVSRSNVQQRRGRAGRCRPGKFFKLYSEIEWNDDMNDSLPPEMQRTPVEELCLQVRALQIQGPIAEILGKALAPPSKLAISNALCLLQSLGALDEEEQLTTLGWKLSAMPLHPYLGKTLLLGSLFGCVPQLLSVCATLSAKSPFVLPFGREREADDAKKYLGRGLSSDHLLYAKVSDTYSHLGPNRRSQWCEKNFISDKKMEMIQSMRQDLRGYLKDLKLGDLNDGGDSWYDSEDLKLGDLNDLNSEVDAKTVELVAALSASLPLAVRPPTERKFRCLEANSGGCTVHPSSLMERLSGKKKGDRIDYPVVCWFSRMKTTDLYLHDVSMIADVLPLLLLSPSVSRRDAPQQGVFEVVWATSAFELDNNEDPDTSDSEPDDETGNGVQSKAPAAEPERRRRWGNATSTAAAKDSWEDDQLDDPEQQGDASPNNGSSSEEEVVMNASAPPTHAPKTKREPRRCQLLLQVADVQLADILWELRGQLQELVGMIIGEPPVRLPKEVGGAFAALRQLLVASYRIHSDDPMACQVITQTGGEPGKDIFLNGETNHARGKGGLHGARKDLFGLDAGEDYDDDRGKGKGKGKRGGKGKGKGKKSGKGNEGGYPWWQHLK